MYTCSPHLRRPLVVIHSEEFDEQASITGLPVLTLLLSPRAQRYFLTFNFKFVPWAVRCTWTKWQWKLVHTPYQHHPHHVFEIIGIERVSNSIQHIGRTRWIYPSHVSPCLSWILKFCSLTLLRWHCLIGWVSQQLLFWDSRRTRVSPFLPFNMSTWHRYWMGIYPTQVFPCSSLTLAWHSCGWWGRRAWGRRRMINFLPWKCHGCWRGQAWGRTRW